MHMHPTSAPYRLIVFLTVLLGSAAACSRQPATGTETNPPEEVPASPLATDEMRRFADAVLASPSIATPPEFTSRVLVPPGHLYDPLYMIVRESGRVWVTDDGGGDGGGLLAEVNPDGRVNVLIAAPQIKRIVAARIAPDGFGSYAGQLISISEERPADVIQRIDLTTKTAVDVCVLPTLPTVPTNPGRPGGAYDAQFGPAGSPFSNRFFATTFINHTVYQVTADGTCTPFITFDGKRFGQPAGIGFTPDGKTMLVSGMVPSAPEGKRGAIARVTPDGAMEAQLVVEGLVRPSGLAQAPEGFGAYGGQWFVADFGYTERGAERGRPMSPDGKIYRIAPDGTLHLVAQGFVYPAGLAFVNGKLWVTAINGDWGGGREVPDGYIVEIQAK